MPPIDLAPLAPLICFALWAVALQFRLAVARASAMRREKRDVTTFKPFGDSENLDAISRAHMNTVENLPVFTVVLVTALWTGAAAPVAAIAWTAFGARVAQSLVHITSRSPNAVRLRAALLLVQAGCFIWLGVQALRAALG